LLFLILLLIVLPDSIAVFVTMGQAQQIDSIKFVVESSTEFNVDAYVSITIPMGTFDALRVKMDDITTTDYSLYCTDTLLGINSGWYPMHSPVPASVANLSADNINIYPIPATKILTVATQNNELTILNLVDVNGKLILKKEFTQSTNLDVSQIAKGIYYLNLSTSEGKLTKKIVIE
jgi:hypothetical protein